MPVALAGRREARHGAARRRLRRLAAGVRVDLGIEHEHVDVLVGRQHVIEAAVADVVGPAVAADDPHRLLHEVVGDREQLGRRGRSRAAEHVLQQTERACAARGCPARRAGPRRGSPRRALRRCAAPARAPARARARPADRSSGACRSRTPRCPRTASSPTPDPGRRRLHVHGVVGRLPPKIDEQPVALATTIRSPNSCVASFRYGVSPQPAHAPENSNSGCRNWRALDRVGFMPWCDPVSGRLRKNAKFTPLLFRQRRAAATSPAP